MFKYESQSIKKNQKQIFWKSSTMGYQILKILNFYWNFINTSVVLSLQGSFEPKSQVAKTYQGPCPVICLPCFSEVSLSGFESLYFGNMIYDSKCFAYVLSDSFFRHFCLNMLINPISTGLCENLLPRGEGYICIAPPPA